MNLGHLKYFYEVARRGSVTRAARELRVSQPAVSKQLALLEEELGCPLFERQGRRLRMSPEGQAAFEHASRIFAEAEALRHTLRSASGPGSRVLHGELGVGISDNLAIHLFPRALGRFRDANPELKLRVFVGTSSDIKKEIEADRCEAGVFFTPTKAHEPFASDLLLETEFLVVTTPACLKTHGIPRARATVSELKAKRVPRIESRHVDYGSGFPAHFHSHGLGLTSPAWLEVNNHEVKKRIVMEGFGFALLTRPTVARELASGELVAVRTPQKLRAPVYWVTRRGRPVSRAALALKAELLA